MVQRTGSELLLDTMSPRMPQDMIPDHVPDGMPDKMPNGMSDGMPDKDVRYHVTQNVRRYVR